jgi:hypothetical protein
MKKVILLVTILLVTFACFSQTKDEIAIIKLLEKESATWRSGDVKGHASCWAIKPYSKILVSTGDSNVIDVKPDLMIHPTAGMVGQGGTSFNTNYKMNINGNNAWVSHEETSIATNLTKKFSFEIRILEKIKGQWKLVGQSIHMYKPK